MLARKKALGSYTLGKTIGQGAFSKVKLGVHKETGQKVAIKIIDKKQMALKAAKAKKAAEDREKRKRHEEAKRQASKVAPAPVESTVRDPRGETPPTDSNPTKKPADNGGKGGENNTSGASKEGDTISTPSFVSSLQLEVQLLMRLEHPNIINLYQIMESEDECYVVMEYASGGELIEYIAARNYLTEKEARKFFRQIISAMDHCHMAHVVHRDLKLENLLLNEERNILISDFGLGRTFNPDVEEYMKTFCGTPNYAAVELISGIPYNGVKSDIWAMGVVLYVMMTGKPPFTGENISALYGKIKAVDYKCPDYFSKDLKVLLSKLLRKDPKTRADMEALRADPWVNFEEVERPLRIIPKVTESPNASQISQFIASITKDDTFVVYNIRQHMRDGSSINGASIEKNRTLKKIATARRRSFSSGPAGMNELIIAKPNNENDIKEDVEDEVSPLPSKTTMAPNPRPRARRMSMLETKFRGGYSSDTSPTSASPSSSIASPDSSSSGIAPRKNRRNTMLDFRIPTTSKNDEKPDLSVTSVGSGSKGDISSQTIKNSVTSPISPNSRSRRASVGPGMYEDRNISVMRRMSMVSPDQAYMQSERGAMASKRGSISQQSTSPISANNKKDQISPPVSPSVTQTPLVGGSISRLPPSQKSEDITNEASKVSEINEEAQTTELSNSEISLLPSKKEIEDWHLMHRPPKEIRTARYSFNSKTTSSLSPSTIFQDLHRVMIIIQNQYTAEKFKFSRADDYYLLNCSVKGTSPEEDVEFEVEVCKLWLLKMHGVRIKRLGGSAFTFKDVYSTICDNLII